MTHAPRPLLHRLFGHWACRTLAIPALTGLLKGKVSPGAARKEALEKLREGAVQLVARARKAFASGLRHSFGRRRRRT